MFEQHGRFKLETSGHTIFLTLYGAWNAEASIACIESIQRITAKISPAPFSMIIDSLEFEGMTSDCISLWVTEIERWLGANIIAVCRIDDPKSVGYRIFLTPFDAIFRNRIPFSFADNRHEAFAWIERVGGHQAAS